MKKKTGLLILGVFLILLCIAGKILNDREQRYIDQIAEKDSTIDNQDSIIFLQAFILRKNNINPDNYIALKNAEKKRWGETSQHRIWRYYPANEKLSLWDGTNDIPEPKRTNGKDTNHRINRIEFDSRDFEDYLRRYKILGSLGHPPYVTEILDSAG